MNKKHVNGTVNEIKGRVKENIGHATGNSRMEGEGMLDRLKGKVEQGLGDLKDYVKTAVDSVLDKRERKSA